MYLNVTFYNPWSSFSSSLWIRKQGQKITHRWEEEMHRWACLHLVMDLISLPMDALSILLFFWTFFFCLNKPKHTIAPSTAEYVVHFQGISMSHLSRHAGPAESDIYYASTCTGMQPRKMTLLIEDIAHLINEGWNKSRLSWCVWATQIADWVNCPILFNLLLQFIWPPIWN